MNESDIKMIFEQTKVDLNDIGKNHCTSCLNQARDVIFNCVECMDEINLCFQCYVYATELGRHEKTHSVRVIDLGTFSLFEPDYEPNFSGKDFDDSIDAIDREIENVEADDENLDKFLHEEIGRELIQNVIPKYPEQFKASDDENIIDSREEEEYDWRAMDEKALFEGLTRVGFGNWKDIANYMNNNVGTSIKPSQVEKHYRQYYIDGPIGRLCWTWLFSDPVIRQLARFPYKIRASNDKIPQIKDSSLSVFSEIPQSELDSIGYLPKRDDFEREFDNEAETLISNLTLGSDNEDDIEKKFKLSQIDMYQRRLVCRFRKKLVIRVSELIKLFLEVYKGEFFKESLQARRDSTNKVFNKDFGEKYPMFMPFIRYLGKEDLNNLFEDVALEQVLKIFLKKLILFSCVSSNNLRAIKPDDKLKMIRVFNKAINSRASQYTARLSDVPANENPRSRGSRNENAENLSNIENMSENEIMNIIFADEDPIDRECLKQIMDHEPISSLSRLLSDFLKKSPKDNEFAKALKFYRELQAEASKEEDSLRRMKIDDDNENEVSSSSGSTAETQDAPKFKLLESEMRLCNELKIEADLYVQFKSALIKQHKKYPKAARHRLNLENILIKYCFGREYLTTLKRIYNHLISANVLSNSQSPSSSGIPNDN